MIRIVLFTLSAAAALGIVLAAQHARTAKLRRLAQLVGGGSDAGSWKVDQSDHRLLKLLLPYTIIRDLRLLGIEPAAAEVAAAAGAFGLTIMVTGMMGGAMIAAALATAVLLGGAMALNILAGRRIIEIGALMPAFFDRVRQLLIIGNSLPTAFARATHGAQPRLVAFFSPTVRRVGNGASFSESVRQSADDIGLYEMHLFAAAVSTNMRFGGSLVHALGNLVAYLRKRSSIERELRSNTAQIRFSAWVLGLLPMLVAALIVTHNKEYASWFITDPTGRWLFGYCIISQIVGAVIMRLIIRTAF